MSGRLRIKDRKKKEVEEEIEAPPKLDKRLIIGCILFVFSLTMFILGLPDEKGKDYSKDKSWKEVTGSINSIEDIYGLYQSKTGNISYLSGYRIGYSYLADDSLYIKEATVESSASHFVNRLRSQNKEKWKAKVFYKKDNPNKSRMITD